MSRLNTMHAEAAKNRWNVLRVINEPPAFRLLKGDAAADSIVTAQAALRRDVAPRAFLEAFLKTITAPGAPQRPPPPDPLPPRS
jgi:hypothetical protein